jgi:hypothetical protein
LRDLFLRGAVALGISVALITELLSPFHLLRRGPVICAWLLVAALAAYWLRSRIHLNRTHLRPLETAIAVAIALIGALVAVTALVSPPNSADAMAYHMPRVIYWAQSGSVAFFPTSYFNQISLQPLAEYFALHTYLLSGGDRLVNLLTCGAFLASIIGVSAIAAAMGATRSGQAFAALFCATLPNGILQASGAKNDWMVTLWLVCVVYFAARRNAPFTALSLGLALATKATAYLFAPALLLAVLLIQRPPIRARAIAWAIGGVLLVNAPQYARNLQLTGSPLGPDSAHADGVYRWRNEHPGLSATVSNAIRHTSEQLGGRSPRWNQAVFRAAVSLHRALGLDPNSPATTWPYTTFTAPENANHEANGNNRWHLLLLCCAALFAAAARKRPWIVYSGGLAAAFLLFCCYLKWQHFMTRLELPLFVLGAPLAAAFLESLRPVLVPALICLFLMSNARLPLLQNWTRPLKGPHSLFVTARDDNYFRDMVQWDNRASYVPAVDLTAHSGCTNVGIDISRNQLEYPFQALLRERNPAVRFVHTGVENISARLAAPAHAAPCAVLCLDCDGDPRKIALYSPTGPPIKLGLFLLFLPPSRATLPAK